MQNWSEETAAKWHQHYDDAASGWAKWADQLADQQEKVNQALLAAAGVKQGSQLLDLASGVGEPAVTAAKLVGDSGQVVATDASAPMIAALRQRLDRLGLANVRCELADMEALPFSDKAFDAVTCRYGLMYVRDPSKALSEARRVLRQGGRVALMVWGPEEANSVVFHGMRAANEFLGHPIPEADFTAPIRFSEAGLLANILTSAGFATVQEQDIVVEPRIKMGTPFWLPLLEMNATDVWSRLDPTQRKATHEAIARAYEPFVVDGSYVLKTHIKLVSGRRM